MTGKAEEHLFMITPRKFWLLLLLVIAGTIISLFLWHIFLPATEARSPFTFWCVLVFVLINVLAYYAGRRATNSKSMYRFVHLILILIIFKMLICVVLVVAHLKINHPESKLFVLPFLSTYLIFTLFEIFVLEKLARVTPEQKKQLS